jgi:hypothetical protein
MQERPIAPLSHLKRRRSHFAETLTATASSIDDAEPISISKGSF